MLQRLLHSGVLPIGLGIGERCVKLLQLRQGRSGLRVVSALRFEFDEFEAGADTHAWIEKLGRALEQHVWSAGFVGRECVVGLSDRFVRSRAVRLPRMPDDDMEKAVRLDAPQRLGFADNEAAQVSWIRAGEVRQGDDSRDEVLVVGAEQSLLERLVYRVAAAGLRPQAVEPDFTACGRCFSLRYRRASERDIVRAVIDIHENSTGVMLLRGPTVAFYKTLEFGGDDFTQAAAEKLGLEPATVADLRRRRMRAGGRGAADIESKVDRALFESIRPIMDDLAHEVALCIRYYGVTFRGSKPVKCVVAGEDACEPRLASFIGESLHVETEVGRPLEDVHTRGASMFADESEHHAQWATPVGLSLRPVVLNAERRESRESRAGRLEREDDFESKAGRKAA